MKKILPIFGMCIVTMSQISFAQEPSSQPGHMLRKFGNLSIDIYGSRNTMNSDWSTFSSESISQFTNGEEACANNVVQQIRKVAPRSLLSKYNVSLNIQIDISNDPFHHESYGYDTMISTAGNLYIRRDPVKNPDCAVDLPMLTNQINTSVLALPSNGKELAKSLNALGHALAAPSSPGQLKASASRMKEVRNMCEGCTATPKGSRSGIGE